jgi:ribosomal protein S18 acetylase RimI-like enzyme
MNIQIRRAGVADTPVIAPLFDAYRQFYEQAPDLALATRFIEERLRQNESTVLLAEDASGQALGFCQLYPSFCSVEACKIFVLYDLFVQPQARTHGVGRQLLLAAEALAREQGVRRLDLTTAKTNLKAQSLYEALGWVRDEVFLTYNRHVN